MRLPIIVLIALLACEVHAAPNLAMACDKAVAGSALKTCSSLKWTEPTASTLVASTVNATSNWTSPDAQWRPYALAVRVLRCSKDITPNQSFRAGVGPDPCPESAKAWLPILTDMITRTAKWTAPVSNDDFSPLIDLAGYHVSVAETLNGPWRLVASPKATQVEIQTKPSERCVSVVARTTTGIQGEARRVCVNKPSLVTDLTFE